MFPESDGERSPMPDNGVVIRDGLHYNNAYIYQVSSPLR